MGRIEQMTKNNTDTDSMTRAEYLAHIAQVYDVPMTLIRYEESNNTEQTGRCGHTRNEVE